MSIVCRVVLIAGVISNSVHSMLLLVALLAAAPLQCPKGTTHQQADGEESCLDADGKLHGPQEFRDDKGVLVHRADYSHGVALKQTTFYPDGSKQMTRTWSDGKRDGTWELNDAHGKTLWSREYANGKLVKETGELDAAMIKEIVGAHKAEVTFCYEKQLREKPKLAGRVSPTFTIGSTGEVTEVHFTENTVADSEVGKCISDKIKKWEFPRPPDGESIEISFPWIFQPSKRND